MDMRFLLVAGVVILLAVVFLIALVQKGHRRDRLRLKYGSEYGRTLSTVGGSSRADAELLARERRVARYDLRPLSAGEQARFIELWARVKAEFVDNPAEAVVHADELVAQVLRSRGYPAGRGDRISSDLSVDHPAVVENYRAARDIYERRRRGQATTEALRQALVHYRALLEALIDAAPVRRAA